MNNRKDEFKVPKACVISALEIASSVNHGLACHRQFLRHFAAKVSLCFIFPENHGYCLQSEKFYLSLYNFLNRNQNY